MPIFYQHEVDNDTRLAVWQIAEGEDFFDVPLQRSISHPHKRLQHRAGRYLLRHLFPDFPLELILVADTRKPFLEDEAFHFSVSHAGDYAAALVSRHRRVGVDIEMASEKVARIRHKFLAPDEALVLAGAAALSETEKATLVWSAKEAAFKWYGRGGVDFRSDMPVQHIHAGTPAGYRTTLGFGKEINRGLTVHSRFLGPLCLSFVAE